MVELRLQRFLDSRGLSKPELCRLTNISADCMEEYIQRSFELTKKNVGHLRRIAAQLNIPIAKLIEPKKKQAGVSLKILDKLQSQDLDLTQLAKRADVDELLVAIYSTQVMLMREWEAPKTQERIGRIASALGTTTQELIIVKDPPVTQLRLQDFLQEKGLSSKELALLWDTSDETVSFLTSQPFDVTSFSRAKRLWPRMPSFCCEYLGFCCPLT